MKKVSFTEMKHGTKEDYLFLDKHEKNFASKTADRIIKFMSELTETLEGYQISRLEHSLQSATRALRAGENEEMIVAALLHDIGDELAPMNHSEYAAAILKPYVSEKTHWIVKKHG
jgi:predicted HD phosphohydrolase